MILVSVKLQRLHRLPQVIAGILLIASYPQLMMAQVGEKYLPAAPTSQIEQNTQPVTSGSSVRRGSGQAQTATIALKNEERGAALQHIAKVFNISLAWSRSSVPLPGKVSLSLEHATLEQVLTEILKGSNGTYLKSADGATITIVPRNTKVDSTAQGNKNAQAALSGLVVDSSNGTPLEGVMISLVGSEIKTKTDANGAFQLNNVSPGSYDLHVRIIGYTTVMRKVTVKIGDTQRIRVAMVIAPTSLNEVVTTATGQQRRVEIPSDIVKIDAEEIKARTPVRNVTDMLEAAQVPGVLVTRGSGEPGAPTRIRMRGIGSISQSNDPVIIVDGVWIDNKSDNQGARGIDAIDPESIETIEIVRGPSAATMYGMDASNGVIVITTKRGRPGTTRWDVGYGLDWGQIYGKKPAMYFGIGRPNPELDTLMVINCPALSRSLVNNNISVMNGNCFQDSVAIYDPNHPLLNNEATETNRRLNLSVSGGTDKLLYSLMFSSQDQIGARREQPIKFVRLRKMGAGDFYDPSRFERPVMLNRRNITTNFTVRPQENLDVMVVVAVSQDKQRRDSLHLRIRGIPDVSEAWSLSLDTIQFLQDAELDHVIRPYNEKLYSSGVRLNSRVNWMPGLGLRFSGDLGLDYGINDRSTLENYIYCSPSQECRDSLGWGRIDRREKNIYSARLSGSTVLNLGRMDRFVQIHPSIGGDYRRGENSSIATSGLYNRFNNVSAGWYLSSTIRVLQRLYFDLGIRQDLGSAITTTSRTGGLPFAGLPKLGSSWLVSDEPFWPHNNIVNLFRLRGAIGYAAVQPDITDIFGVYRDRAIYTDSSRFVRGVLLDAPPNHMLVPEKAGEIELGFDSEMLNEKLYMVLTYSHKENRNAIVTRQLAPSAGFDPEDSRKQNIARVVNKTFELSTTARIIESKATRLQANYNLTLSENKVAELGHRITPFNAGTTGRIAEGYPVASQWSRVVLAYQDANGDGIISPNEVVVSDSLVYRGWSQPRHRSSFGMSLELIGAVTFDSRFSYQGNYAQRYTFDGFRGREDIASTLLVQAMYQAQQDGGSSMSGTRTVSDMRWNSASITFHLPSSFVRRLNSRSVQVRLQGSNLALWSNYSGRDPGVNSGLLGTNPGEGVFDNGGAMPRPRLFALELRWGI